MIFKFVFTFCGLLSLVGCQYLENFVNDNSDLSIVKHELLSINSSQGFTTYTLNLTSLQWFSPQLSDRSVWWHNVFVSVPDNLDEKKPILYLIDDGRNEANDTLSERSKPFTSFSVQCKCITVIQRQIPNQPIKFTGDPENKYRIEDDIIATTFALYLYNKTLFPQETYNYVPLLFPMVKSVKRGFDETIKFLKSRKINFTEKFVVGGASKRGWTSWLVTAVDQRIIATVPIVFDLLKWNENFHNQYMSYGGGYSYALFDYYSIGSTQLLDTLNTRELLKLIDPISYIEKYRGKKFLLFTANNDQFFLPQNTRAWWRDLSIQTDNQVFIKRFPNVDHFLSDETRLAMLKNVKSFLDLINRDADTTRTLPIFNWSFENSLLFGKIEAKLSNLNEFESYSLKAYWSFSENKEKIDFRGSFLLNSNIRSSNVRWSDYSIVQDKLMPNSTIENSYKTLRVFSLFRYMAFYVDVTLKLKNSDDVFTISTDFNIMPEYYPVGDCHGKECFGNLI
ncbi:autocrine proliferation repressor A-like [Brachionus plicatilis]|uniref:Autocrine proliferation repressor A-like n=1 Tax=Brachionus plicatilis TaxID=10195 RepID=A0A3M7RA92_BRAPC|nr:autocrine proliferation repressor A-like [Brachionus plicatilis]